MIIKKEAHMNIIYKVKTNKDFNSAVESVKQKLSERSFGVLWELNLKNKLEEKGESFDRNIQVLEVCNPKKAKAVLDIDIEVGYFLPCKVVVYENNNEVYIGMPKPTELIGLFEDSRLESHALEVENVLKDAIDDAK